MHAEGKNSPPATMTVKAITCTQFKISVNFYQASRSSIIFVKLVHHVDQHLDQAELGKKSGHRTEIIVFK